MNANLGDMSRNQSRRLAPASYRLLETCLEIKTTNTKILAGCLHRSPATIRTQFQRILALMDAHCRYEALRITEERGLIRRKRR
ncbi:DNA-binding response regulator [Nitrosomonas ureae]|uniref:Regulatory protein, luxR family n=1 Tax=Nitrosomonas ureae TaxID=44577 RepID=A0A1H5UT91_9PROT|nr:DNA-binding response regulator [Nitrosomonas ureae]SEF78200.1 hypothetical protein SAMN05216334_10943 [Nitrosomonas ureae]